MKTAILAVVSGIGLLAAMSVGMIAAIIFVAWTLAQFPLPVAIVLVLLGWESVKHFILIVTAVYVRRDQA